MSTVQAIVFDLDDTLYPECEYVFSGFRAVAQWAEAQHGISAEQGCVELKALFEAGVRGDTFNRWLAAHGAADVAAAVKVYREHQPTIAPFTEVVPLLERLRGRYKIGLLSDGYLSVQQAKWMALGLERWFEAVVFSDAWGREAWKPSRQPFDEVLRRLGVSAGQAVYVADNPKKDFIGARGAGMRSIRVRRMGGEYSALEPETPAHAADVTVQGLDEVETALEAI